MSSHQEPRQTRNPEHIQKVAESRPAEQQTGQNCSAQKAEPDAEDDVDTDPEDLQLEQQHAEYYDSDADDKDQEWVQKQRQGRRSDAILSCPGCLTTVCIDCQRHEFYTTQYRAMFTMNCRSALLSALLFRRQLLAFLPTCAMTDTACG